MPSKCLGYLSGVGGWVGGWVAGWVAGSYSDIKTNLSQVGLDWDWPTGLSLATFEIYREEFIEWEYPLNGNFLGVKSLNKG